MKNDKNKWFMNNYWYTDYANNRVLVFASLSAFKIFAVSFSIASKGHQRAQPFCKGRDERKK